MSPVAFRGHKVVIHGHKVCRTCCGLDCPDPNGCEGLPHKWSLELHGTPFDGIYEVKLTNCGCAECPSYECPGGVRNGGSSWEHHGDGFKVGLHWQCLPAPDGQFWAVIVTFMHEGVERECWVDLPGETDACFPEGIYDHARCSDDPGSVQKCWTEWCSSFWAEVGTTGSMLAATVLQSDGKRECKACRGLA